MIPRLDRRKFLRLGLAGLATPLLPGCGQTDPFGVTVADPHLTARPQTPSVAATLGESTLGLGGQRDGLLYVPQARSEGVPLPLLIALHGSGGSAKAWTSWYARAETLGFAFLAIDSRSSTWELSIGSAFGRDFEFIDSALKHTFDRVLIDPARVGFAGYSDGASYALSLGALNGDLFTHLIAYAPGFFAPAGTLIGKPLIFLAHGTQDRSLPVEGTRRLSENFTASGYDVTYREFEGTHQIPSSVAREGVDWFLPAG